MTVTIKISHSLSLPLSIFNIVFRLTLEFKFAPLAILKSQDQNPSKTRVFDSGEASARSEEEETDFQWNEEKLESRWRGEFSHAARHVLYLKPVPRAKFSRAYFSARCAAPVLFFCASSDNVFRKSAPELGSFA